MNNRTVISSGNGVLVQARGRRVALDTKSSAKADVSFVSHAHIDHIHTSGSEGVVMTSRETAMLAKERGFDMGRTVEESDGLKMLDSGHVFGSRSLLIDDEIFYTGDFAGRSRAFLATGQIAKCQTLIIESTFGQSKYRFPSVEAVVDKVNRLISDIFSKGKPVVLMGYPFGKAQVLSYLFQTWEPLYLHKSVWQMNQVHGRLGAPIRSDLPSYSEAVDEGVKDDSLKQGPWVLIAPLRHGRSQLPRKLKDNYGAVTIGFSGWAVEPGYRRAMALDHAFPLSDHCDYQELIDVVKKCEPEEVYTFHGFTSEFAATLRRMGFCAQPLLKAQRALSDYGEAD